jgi:hypothetical protein
MDDKTLRQLQDIGTDLCALWVEAASVIWLRSHLIAGGGAQGAKEAKLMVSEKVAVHQELVAGLLAGRLGKTPLAVTARMTRRMLKGVRANRQRLSRG